MSVKSNTGRLAVLGALVLTGAVLLAGCGGDDDSGSTSKEDFIASADKICADFREQSDSMRSEFNEALNSGDLEAAADVFQQQSDGMASAIDEVEALEVPEGDEDTIAEFISLSREQVDATTVAADAIRNDDNQALQAAIAEGEDLDKQSDEIADEYGLIDCGSAGDDDSSEAGTS